jgi:hypothetical protein
VVGSAIVQQVAKFGNNRNLVPRVVETVEPLIAAVKSISGESGSSSS